MMLWLLGWSVVNSVWIGTAIGGLMFLVLALLPQRRARARHAAAYTALVLMAVVPLLVTATSLDLLSSRLRAPATALVDETVGLSMVVVGRAWIVRSAALVWVVGVALFTARVFREWRRLRPVWREEMDDAGADTRALVASLKDELRVAAPVRVVRSRRAEVPMVVGFRASTILLPWHTIRHLSAEQLRGIVAHELAHVRRRDAAANLMQLVLDGVLWFHPAARWVSRRVRVEREYCCDDVAVKAGVDGAEYARALAALEDARHDCRLVVAAASGTLLHRIQRIVGQPAPPVTLASTVATAIVTLLAAAAFATLTQIVPPRMPLDARLRMRRPAPAGTIVVPAGPSLPRSPRPAQR